MVQLRHTRAPKLKVSWVAGEARFLNSRGGSAAAADLKQGARVRVTFSVKHAFLRKNGALSVHLNAKEFRFIDAS
jgi:hypothetical protein